jgi:hypothetical protein
LTRRRIIRIFTNTCCEQVLSGGIVRKNTKIGAEMIAGVNGKSTMDSERATLPVAVIGAGPVGLAAAAHLVEAGETPVVLEAGNSVGASMLSWGHVKVFSPWQYNIDKAARQLLENSGWTAPDPDYYPTGREIVEQYLVPLRRSSTPPAPTSCRTRSAPAASRRSASARPATQSTTASRTSWTASASTTREGECWSSAAATRPSTCCST